MGLFDLFSFKKDSQKAFSKEFFTDVFSTAREAIISLAKDNIPGIEKKEKVDAIVTATIYAKTVEVKNKYVLWLIDRFIELVPTITQLIYDFLKEKVESL